MGEDHKGVPTSSRRRRYNRAMRWIRRIHLYLGLFMFPWLLLYGLTGLFFNHPTFLPNFEIRSVGPDDLDGTGLAELPAPETVARRLLERIARNDREESVDLRLVRPDRARYRNVAGFNTARDGKRYQLLFFPSKGSGRLNIRPPEPNRSTPFDGRKRLELDRGTRQELQRGAVEAFQKLGVETKEARLQFGPLLEFEMEAEGKTWLVRYNLGNGNLYAVPTEGGPGVRSVRDYLIRLHVTHGFPPEPGTRTAWALVVDLMAIALILWVVTGLLMWWQMKVVRLTGAIVLTVSALWAFGIGYLMYDFFRYLL